MTLRVGLTGGIGSGKTSIAKILARHGALIVDADNIARQVRAPGTDAHDQILKYFGTTDTQALRSRLSQDKSAKIWLEKLLHPLIQNGSEIQMSALEKSNPDAPLIVYEASLLVEANRYADFPVVILATSDPVLRRTRIQNRDHCSADQANAMIHSQLSDSDRESRMINATKVIVIENSGTLEELEKNVTSVLAKLLDPRFRT